MIFSGKRNMNNPSWVHSRERQRCESCAAGGPVICVDLCRLSTGVTARSRDQQNLAASSADSGLCFGLTEFHKWRIIETNKYRRNRLTDWDSRIIESV